MTPPTQESGGTLSTPSTTLQTATLQPSNENVQPDKGEASQEKRPRGRPKGSVKKRPTLEAVDRGNIGDLPKRPRGRPRKSETINTPKRPRGRPKKTVDTGSLPTRERSDQNDISMIFNKAKSMLGTAASTSGQTPGFKRQSIQTFSVGHDNPLGRWDVEQLVLNMTGGADNQLAVNGSIRLGFRAQEHSREERENLGQIRKAPRLQDGEQVNISFTGQATSQ